MQTKGCWAVGVAAVALMAVTGGAARAAGDPFGDFVSPVSNPTNFEDPRATTEIRPIYAYHGISNDFVTGGGDAQVAAVQLRVALSDRWSLIATKDGYVWLSPDSVVPHNNGWANLAAGVKYTFYRDPERRAMAAAAAPATTAAATRGRSNGKRASGSVRRTSGRTASASARRSGPRTNGVVTCGAKRRLVPEAERIEPSAARTAAPHDVGPWTRTPFERAMPPSRSFSMR